MPPGARNFARAPPAAAPWKQPVAGYSRALERNHHHSMRLAGLPARWTAGTCYVDACCAVPRHVRICSMLTWATSPPCSRSGGARAPRRSRLAWPRAAFEGWHAGEAPTRAAVNIERGYALQACAPARRQLWRSDLLLAADATAWRTGTALRQPKRVDLTLRRAGLAAPLGADPWRRARTAWWSTWQPLLADGCCSASPAAGMLRGATRRAKRP